jgi:hypothetical protein
MERWIDQVNVQSVDSKGIWIRQTEIPAERKESEQKSNE